MHFHALSKGLDMTWQLGAGADLSVSVSFQLFCRNWCSSSTLMNCVLASEGPSTLPSDNVGLIGGEVPHQSRIRLRANGLEWDWLLGLCQHRGFLMWGTMDISSWVLVLPRRVLAQNRGVLPQSREGSASCHSYIRPNSLPKSILSEKAAP